MTTGEIFVVFRKTTAAAEPTIRALSDPALWQEVKTLCYVRTLYDLERNTCLLFYFIGGRLALMASFGDRFFLSFGKRSRAIARSGAIMCLSCTSPGVTARLISRPTVSTTV